MLETRPPTVGEAVRLGRGVELGPRQAAADAHDPALGVDDDLAQAADVDDEAVVDERQAGHRVAAGAHGDAQVAERARTPSAASPGAGASSATTWRGRRSIMPLKSVQASSYSGSPGS